MKPNTEQLKQAQEALDNASVPTSGRFYRYIDENGNTVVGQMDAKLTIGSLFPCLRSKK